MPDYVVLISTLGGLALFGLNGFVIGPLVDLLPDCRLPDGTPVADYWPAVAAQPLQRLHCLEENHFADRTH